MVGKVPEMTCVKSVGGNEKSELKGITATVIARGDTYDTGKNSVKASSENHGHDATDSGKDALTEEAAVAVK